LAEAKKSEAFLVLCKSTKMPFFKLKTEEKIFPLIYTVMRKRHISKSRGIKPP